jgi:hypothetical protein
MAWKTIPFHHYCIGKIINVGNLSANILMQCISVRLKLLCTGLKGTSGVELWDWRWKVLQISAVSTHSSLRMSYWCWTVCYEPLIGNLCTNSELYSVKSNVHGSWDLGQILFHPHLFCFLLSIPFFRKVPCAEISCRICALHLEFQWIMCTLRLIRWF